MLDHHSVEVDELEEDNRLKEKEIAKLNKAISKSKSKKETQSLVEELISTEFIDWCWIWIELGRILYLYEEARAESEQAMQQVRALQEMLRSQPAGTTGGSSNSVEMKVLQRNLEATQAELEKTEARVTEILQEKTKLEQNLFRSHQEMQDLQKSIDARVASKSAGLKLELDTAKDDLTRVQQEVWNDDDR